VVTDLLADENQPVNKHVENLLVPRLDEGSNPSSSTIALDYHQVAQFTPNFTPKKCNVGCFCYYVVPNDGISQLKVHKCPDDINLENMNIMY